MPTMTMRQIGAIVGTLILLGGLIGGASLTVLAQDGSNGDDSVEVPEPQPGGDYDCGQFKTREQVEAVFNASNDEYGLDRDGDGIACENVGESVDEPTNETTEEEPTNETDAPTNETTEEEPTDDTPANETEQPPADDDEMKDDEMKDDKKQDDTRDGVEEGDEQQDEEEPPKEEPPC